MAAMAIPLEADAYDAYIERMRRTEYPMLGESIYLDHAGTTLYSKTLVDRFQQDMMANLYGNPHSASTSSQRSTEHIEDVRLALLHLFNADPEYFDLVFTANATAAIKLVGDAFREHDGSFWYGYHADAHTSLVGLRELARVHQCFETDEAVEQWLESSHNDGQQSRLFAYPAQSNMNGRRLPLNWNRRLRGPVYTLVDAAALASTTPLDLSDPKTAPDFTAVSLYKIFGFPDLGALIVRRAARCVFDQRKYFGGGTVDMVSCLKEQWHAKKSGALHERLEDGTLPVHSLIAVKAALQTHQELFVSLEQISRHTARLAKKLYDGLASLRHGNGHPVCAIHKHPKSSYLDTRTQGPIIAFNLRNSAGTWVSNTEVEKLASIRDIHLRTGGVCNPGGVAQALHLRPWELQENFSAGHRCGGENDIFNGKPTGVIRLSLGAMSAMSDVHSFLEFTREFFVEKTVPQGSVPLSLVAKPAQRFYVESLAIYPIKSCGGYQIPHRQAWEVRPHGLAWDREWCILHQGTGKALSQKQNPRMALIRPTLDFDAGCLRITTVGGADSISVPLSRDPILYNTQPDGSNASVCGDAVDALVYAAPSVSEFLARVIGIPCVLARQNPAASFRRHCKTHLQRDRSMAPAQPIYMANESPILTISRSSLNRLNEQIKAKGGKAALPSVFRANIILAEDPSLSPGSEQPWAEDGWTTMQVGGADGPTFDFLGGCRRCQMVCVDQCSAEKNPEPFVTLAKTRRFDGRVLFGVHTAVQKVGAKSFSIMAGNAIVTSTSRGG